MFTYELANYATLFNYPETSLNTISILHNMHMKIKICVVLDLWQLSSVCTDSSIQLYTFVHISIVSHVPVADVGYMTQWIHVLHGKKSQSDNTMIIMG